MPLHLKEFIETGIQQLKNTISKEIITTINDFIKKIETTKNRDTSVQYTNFNKKRTHPLEFPIYKWEDIPTTLHEKNFENVENSIIEVDFSENEHYTDYEETHMCVQVMASNGNKGTMSHLTIPQFEEERKNAATIFAEKLSLYWGKQTPEKQVPVCLIGGVDGISETTLTTLKKVLAEKGFLVSDNNAYNNTGGILVYRKATLYKDKIIVDKETYSGDIEKIMLTFPPNKSTTV